jgi:hypothetical protein
VRPCGAAQRSRTPPFGRSSSSSTRRSTDHNRQGRTAPHSASPTSAPARVPDRTDHGCQTGEDGVERVRFTGHRAPPDSVTCPKAAAADHRRSWLPGSHGDASGPPTWVDPARLPFGPLAVGRRIPPRTAPPCSPVGVVAPSRGPGLRRGHSRPASARATSNSCRLAGVSVPIRLISESSLTVVLQVQKILPS